MAGAGAGAGAVTGAVTAIDCMVSRLGWIVERAALPSTRWSRALGLGMLAATVEEADTVIVKENVVACLDCSLVLPKAISNSTSSDWPTHK
jgi:hypothetical protein